MTRPYMNPAQAALTSTAAARLAPIACWTIGAVAGMSLSGVQVQTRTKSTRPGSRLATASA